VLKIGFYGRNLTNSEQLVSVQVLKGGDIVRWAQPRTYGVQLQFKY